MKKVLKGIWSAFVWLVAVAAVAVMLFTVVSVNTLDQTERNFMGYRGFVVLSDSMSATDFSAGDVAVVKDAEISELQVGDIISYTSKDESNYGSVVTHKIREISTDENGNTVFTTYGTTTDTNDPLTVEASDVIGRYVFRIPYAGSFFEFLKTVPGYFVCIFTPFMILIIWQLITVIRLFKQYRAEVKAEKQQDNASMQKEIESLKKQLAAAQKSLQDQPE